MSDASPLCIVPLVHLTSPLLSSAIDLVSIYFELYSYLWVGNFFKPVM